MIDVLHPTGPDADDAPLTPGEVDLLLRTAFGEAKADAGQMVREEPANSDPSDPSAIPGSLGRHEVRGVVGRGGMGIVLRAYDARLTRDVAVKTLGAAEAGDAKLTARFLEEARIAARLQHPGIIPIYDVGVAGDGTPYFTMRLVQGRTLSELLAEAGEQVAERVPRFLGIVLQVAQAMAYAHDHGVVHRDLKPSNIFVGEYGEVQVLDWGLATTCRERRAGGPATWGGTSDAAASISPDVAPVVVGTFESMPPEQARGSPEAVDPRADVFALGGLLCEVITGAPPFRAENRTEARRLALEGDTSGAIARLRDAGVHPELAAIAETCLAPRPGDRPTNAGVVAHQLATHLRQVAERADADRLRAAASEARAAEAQGRAQAERRARRLSVTLAIAGIVASAAIGGTAWLDARKRARVESEVLVALADAEIRCTEAEAPLDPDPALWERAVAAARVAAEVARTGGASAELSARTTGLFRRVSTAAAIAIETARQSAADGRLATRLQAARDAAAVHARISRSQEEILDALRDHGIDLESATVAAPTFQNATTAEVVITVLDWLADERRALGAPGSLSDSIVAFLQRCDGDRDRRAIRTAIAARNRDFLIAIAGGRDFDALSAGAHALLASGLGLVGERSLSIDSLRRAQARRPGDFWINCGLGFLLDAPESIAFLRAAVAIRPTSPLALSKLAQDLRLNGDRQSARDLYARLVELLPGEVSASTNLLLILEEMGDPVGAVAAARAATERLPNVLDVWDLYSRALLHVAKDAKRAEAACRTALSLDPKDATIWHRLGLALAAQDRRSDAEAAYREAIRHGPEQTPESYCNLARLLVDRGCFVEALPLLRTGHDLGSSRPGWSYPSAAWIAEAEAGAATESAFVEVLAGRAKPVSADQCLAFVDLARRRADSRLEVFAYDSAFTADPTLGRDPRIGYRVRAASAALRARSTETRPGPGALAADAGELASSARQWLLAELESLEARVTRGEGSKERILGVLDGWLSDPALSQVFGEDGSEADLGLFSDLRRRFVELHERCLR